MDEKGQASQPVRAEHDRSELREFLRRLQAGSKVIIKSTGGWYWLVDEIEAAGLKPQLANAYHAKQRMAGCSKTDKFDARELAMELLTGTLPTVWIPPADLRDLRGLLRSPVGSSSGAAARRLLLGLCPRFPSSCPFRIRRGRANAPALDRKLLITGHQEVSAAHWAKCSMRSIRARMPRTGDIQEAESVAHQPAVREARIGWIVIHSRAAAMALNYAFH